MLGLTSLEKSLALLALVLAGILGLVLYERHAGAVSVITRDTKAEVAQVQQDRKDDTAIVASLQKQLVSLPNTIPAAIPMFLCSAPNRVPEIAASRPAEPVALPISTADSGVQSGTQSGTNVGPAVQDITLAGVLVATDLANLWKLENDEASHQTPR
jgi:hypothetical protein